MSQEDQQGGREAVAHPQPQQQPHVHPHTHAPAPAARPTTLGVASFGLAVGLTWALFVFTLGMLAALLGWGVEIASALSSLYMGYGPFLVGAVAGGVWAFAHGFVTGVLVAFIYNRLLLAQRRHPR